MFETAKIVLKVKQSHSNIFILHIENEAYMELVQTILVAAKSGGSVFLGALTGAIVFVISAPRLAILHRVVLFFVSMVAGILSASFTTSLLNIIIPLHAVVPPGVGALIASTISVRLLFALSIKSPYILRNWLKRKGGNLRK